MLKYIEPGSNKKIINLLTDDATWNYLAMQIIDIMHDAKNEKLKKTYNYLCNVYMVKI